MTCSVRKWEASTDELPIIMGLAETDRREFDRKRAIVETVLQAPCKRSETKRCVALYEIPEKTIYRWVNAVEKGGVLKLIDSRLIKKALRVKSGGGLKEAFIEFLHVLFMSNDRKTAPAYRSLFFDHLIPGKEIPGYGTWRDIFRAEFQNCPVPQECPYRPYQFTPSSWSYQNLCRFQPHQHALQMARVGRGSAKQFLPPVPTSRVGLHVGQYILWDDVWHDHKVNLVGTNNQEMRVIQLGALDLLSGYYRCGMMPRTIDYTTGSKRNLREKDIRLFMASVLRGDGYHPDGAVLVMEHGTASASADFERHLSKCSGGNIKIDRSGKLNTPLIDGLWDGRPRGNPRFKAALESWHNLFHNECAALDGSVGRDWDNCPEKLYGESKHNGLMLKVLAAVCSMYPERAELFRLPFMHFEDYSKFVYAYIDRINQREEHSLQGFQEAGLVIPMYRMFPDQPFRNLKTDFDHADDALKAAITAAVENPKNRFIRVMSPEEVYNSQKHKLVKFPAWGMPGLLGEDCCLNLSATASHTFDVKSKEFGPDKIKFYSLLHRTDGTEEIIHKSIRKYRCFLNPVLPNEMFVCNEDGAFLGTALRIDAPCRADYDAAKRSSGQVIHLENKLAQQWRPYGQKMLKERVEAAQDNIAAMSGILPEDIREEEAYQVEQEAEFSAIDHILKKTQKMSAE